MFGAKGNASAGPQLNVNQAADAAERRPSRPRRTRPPARRDWGRLFAFVLCVAFAVIGAVPLALGLLVRTSVVRTWAARETATLLRDKLGIDAQYDVRVQAWPPALAVEDLVVEATDGGKPFLAVERLAIRPRIFSLLAGEIDAGDVEIVGPRIRAVIKGGALQNFKLPDVGGGSASGAGRAPLSSVAITDARIDITVDGLRVEAREVDLDLSTEQGDAFETALRAGRITLVNNHPFPGREAVEDTVDEDVVCRFDTRVRLERDQVLIRRLTLQGSADLDPDPGTAPPCALPEDDWRRVDVDLGALRVVGLSGLPSKVSGRLRARLPVPILHRFVDAPHATGSVTLDVEVDHDTAGVGPSELLRTLPRIQGTLTADQPGLDGVVFVTRLAAELTTTPDTVRLSDADITWADGKFKIARAEVKPFEKGMPLQAGPIDLAAVELPGLLRDLGAHPQAHVAWTLREGRFERFGGTISPLALEGYLAVQTRGFEIFDRPTTDAARRPLMGVKEGTVRGLFQVRPDAVVLSNFAIDTPRSHLETTVTLGFNDYLGVEISPASRVELEEISPLASLELSGLAALRASMRGPYERPLLTGEVGVTGFVLAGFPLGDLEPSAVAFEPLVLSLDNARLRHGASRVRIPSLRVDFDTAATVAVDATVDTRDAPHLAIKDLLEILRLDRDPRFAAYEAVASGTARARFAVGGPEDRCGGGFLDVQSSMRLSDIVLLGETYDDGELEMGLVWDDQAAGADGMRLDVRSASLRKGAGTILASASVQHGGALKASAVANGVPIESLDALGAARNLFKGSVSAVATLGGTISRLEGLADVHVSRVRIGPASLPPSQIEVAIRPLATPVRVIGRTRCNNPQTAPFDPADFDRDLPDGAFVANGSLFGGQISLADLRITRRQRKLVSGKILAAALDLGALANLIPGVPYAAAPPRGELSAALDIERLPLANPRQASGSLSVSAMDLEWRGRQLRLRDQSGPLRLEGETLTAPALGLEVRTTSGFSALFTAGGRVQKLATAPELDVGIQMAPTRLSQLSRDIPQIRRANGTVRADLKVTGPVAAPRYAGSASLKEGELSLDGLPMSLDDIDVDIAIRDDFIRLVSGKARLGAGAIDVSGSIPVRGLELGTADAKISARNLRLPVAEGVNITADAELRATFRPGATSTDEDERNLPQLGGTVTLTSFSYTRPIVMSVDLGDLTGRQRTAVETYDPARDVVRFDVNVVSPKPLRFSNNLADMRLEVSPSGLALSGTNQRFGARGTLRILPASRLMLRNTEFEVREGYVRFDDLYRIAPKVDVHAETEYRRYASTSGASGEQQQPAGPGDAAALTSTSGHWRIKLHAHGEADDLRLALSSDPALSQEDILLLLTLGMTRAEIDRGLTSSLGESFGLEALSTLTGADKAVKTIVPLIDEFRFGTGYSSRSGRTEPAVTLGKRITDDVRANVTTSLAESREVRAGVEVKLSDRMSVQGSYDNANEATSLLLGNIGADLRFRLEFE